MMMRYFLAFLGIILAASSGVALLHGEYRSIDQIADARNLMIVQAQPLVERGLISEVDGVTDYDVRILGVLRGPKLKQGEQTTVSTTTQLEAGTRYLLAGEHASRNGKPWLLFHWTLGVVEIPAEFDIEALQGKPIRGQVVTILTARAKQIEGKTKALEKEKGRLDVAVAEEKKRQGQIEKQMRALRRDKNLLDRLFAAEEQRKEKDPEQAPHHGVEKDMQ